MTRFTIAPRNLNRWMKQNGIEELADCREGVLLDSFIGWTKNGVAAIYEHYVNAWSSDYLVEFERGDGLNVWHRWEDFCEEYDKETA